jgi:hypothetical protein
MGNGGRRGSIQGRHSCCGSCCILHLRGTTCLGRGWSSHARRHGAKVLAFGFSAAWRSHCCCCWRSHSGSLLLQYRRSLHGWSLWCRSCSSYAGTHGGEIFSFGSILCHFAEIFSFRTTLQRRRIDSRGGRSRCWCSRWSSSSCCWGLLLRLLL